MGFFASVPAPEPPEVAEYRPPPWSAPPDNVLPAAVALDAVLVRRDDIVVWIADGLAYPDGAVLSAGLLRRDPPAPERAHAPFLMLPGQPGAPRFGVGFADGRKAVLGARLGGSEVDRASGAALHPMGSTHGQRRWEARFWLWPLPPRGTLTLAFEWADEGIDEATVEIDAAPLVAAAGRARELWPEERPAGPRG